MEINAIREYYDRFAKKQLNAGTNERHRRILQIALAHGLRDGMRVLEAGCGVGCLTELLLQKLRHGELSAIDLSPVSIRAVADRLRDHRNLSLEVGDIVTFQFNSLYDMIILPDVLEHIPKDRHAGLFTNLFSHLSPQGKLIIHSPDPFYLDHLRDTHPELLQVVDISLHLPELIIETAQAGFSLHHFQRHSIWTSFPDYMVLVLIRTPNELDPDPPLPAHRPSFRFLKWLNRNS